MVDKCANPECAARFRYLHEGRLFQVDMRHLSRGREEICEFCGHPLHVRHFWLCDACARTMTLTCTTEGSVKLASRSIVDAPPVPLACPSRRSGRTPELDLDGELTPRSSPQGFAQRMSCDHEGFARLRINRSSAPSTAASAGDKKSPACRVGDEEKILMK